MTFPPEVFEKILFRVDAVTLTRLKAVCKLWKVIIEQILKNNDHWYKKCTEEIPEDLWSALYEKIELLQDYCDSDRKQGTETWMNMYKLWMQCKNIVKSKESMEQIQPVPKYRVSENITSMAVSDKFLGIGTSQGRIYFYEKNNLNCGLVFLADQIDAVQNLMFYHIDKKTVAVSRSNSNTITFWDVSARKQIAKNHAYLVCAAHKCCFTCVKNILTIETPTSVKTYFAHGIGDIVAIGVNKNEVILYTEYGNYVKSNFKAIEKESICMQISPPSLRIHRYFVFKPGILVCLAEFGYVGFLVEGTEWKMHNMFSVLHGNPTALAICARLFAVGLESGDVHMYHIEDYETVNFSTANSKRLTLERTAVISIDITFHLGGLYLIVAYSKNVYMVKFI